MKHLLFFLLITAAFLGSFLSTQYFDKGPYVGEHISFTVTDGYLSLEAWGILRLTNAEESEDYSQSFHLSNLDALPGKVLLYEGFGNHDSISFTSPVILDIVSIDDNQVIARNDIWTVTIQADTVLFQDKDGKTGQLSSGFLAK